MVVDHNPASATTADTDATMTAARNETDPGFPKATRSIQNAASRTANRNRNSGISHDSQSPGVVPHGGWPIPRTMFDANGIPTPRVTRAPSAAYTRGQRASGRARITAYTAISTSAELIRSAAALAVSGPASLEK